MKGEYTCAIYRGIRARKKNDGQWVVLVDLPGEPFPIFASLCVAMGYIDGWVETKRTASR